MQSSSRHRPVRALVAAAVLALALPAVSNAWTPDNYYYGRGPCGSFGGAIGTGADSGRLPAFTQTVSINPNEDERTLETVHHVTKVIPRVRRSVEHVYHRTKRVNHVVHNINQDVLVQNVRVHHDLVDDQTIHHYRHRTNYIRQDLNERGQDTHRRLPNGYESDSPGWADED